MNRFRAYGVWCVLMFLAAAAQATTIVLPSDEQLIEKAPVIVEGTVVSTTPVDRDGKIWTETVVSVARTIKGRAAETIIVREIGGEIGDRITKLFGSPEFSAGERVLLFLSRDARGGYRVVDLFVGKFSAAEMMNGQRIWLREDIAQEVTLLDRELRPVARKNVQRGAAAFEQFVFDRIAGRKGTKNYAIENPVLARQVSDETSRGGITSNFELISEPSVYRWFAFDGGTTVDWQSGGTQPGYSDGGVAELRTAMSSWTGYSGAKIYFSYSGVKAAPYGGLSRANGVNEVLFNDPLKEIEGSWSRTSGGVVGTGGFNGVTHGGTWTAPFTADDKHRAGPVRAYNITEGNLTIQDGVSPTTGFSSSRLAEVISHEFGHTLGFGHSADGTALMYASVTGLGPSLREDDKLAARWLYPNGGTAPPPPTEQAPAAPTDLTATASSSNLDLRWSDNASNETGYSIYLAVGTGAFSKVADTAANAVSARLSGLSAGSYRAYVVAFNGAGQSSPSNTASATIAAAPVAAFSFTPQSGTAGVTTFTFYDESQGSVTSRVWSFGDGRTSSASVATNVYAAPGQYTVTLTVTGGGGTSQLSKVVSVAGPLQASFAWSPSAPIAGDTIRFEDQSSGGPLSWHWSFGDGSASSQQNPSKQFSAAGTYTVTLTAYRNSEWSTATRQITVTPSAPVVPAVVAAFDISPLTPEAGSAATLVDRSTGAPTKWSWSFGDGRTSTAQDPVHTWAAAGTYNVTLTVSNATSSATVAKQITVSAAAPYRSLIPAAAQISGVGGTSWRTELSLFNAGAQGASVTLLFVPGAGGSVISRSLYLSPRQSITYANALLDLFGMSSGAGAVSVEAASAGSSADIRVVSRTFTSGSGGTYGQGVPDVRTESFATTLYVTGIQSSAAYRTNIGLVNRGDAPAGATLSLYDSGGTLVGSQYVTLAANSFQQSPLSTLFPAVSGGSYDGMSMRIAASHAVVSAYASVIDNASQDPVYIQAIPAPTTASLTVPAVGRAPGVNGTFWRSDVALFNPAGGPVTVALSYGNGSRTITLAARQTFVLRDVLSWFSQTSGSGALRITSSGGTAPVVTSRAYTTAANGGTYGQAVGPVASFGSETYVPGLRNDASFRSNVGFVNGGSETESFTVVLLSQYGTELARTSVTLAAGGQVQHSVAALFPNAFVSGGLTLHVKGGADAKLFAYGSMIDNVSGDPVFYGGR